MAFLEHPTQVRLGKEQKEKIKQLLQLDGSLESESHVIRCALNYFYDFKVKQTAEGKTKRII